MSWHSSDFNVILLKLALYWCIRKPLGDVLCVCGGGGRNKFIQKNGWFEIKLGMFIDVYGKTTISG